MNLPTIKLDQGIHTMHLFYRVNRTAWAHCGTSAAAESLEKLAALCAANSAPSQPLLRTFANVGGKADLVFWLFHAELGGLAQLHRDVEACFPPGTLERVYSYLSITELVEYMPKEEDNKRRVQTEFKLEPGTPAFAEKLAELEKLNKEYEHYRLNPEMPDWEVMCFYPMLKKRDGADNWYSLDFETRKKLMRSHGVTGRKFANRIKQLITGSSGLDDWEWGVTLMAHQVDAFKEIIYEMRLDEVSARFGEFGPFYINMRLQPAALWQHLRL